MKKVILFFLLCLTAYGEPYWVSSNGAASWASAQSAIPLIGTACTDLDAANANASAGDTVFLRAGTYYGVGFLPQNSGTSGNPIVWEAYDNEDVNLVGDSDTSKGFFLDTISYNHFRGFDVDSMEYQMWVLAGTYNRFVLCSLSQYYEAVDSSLGWRGSTMYRNSRYNVIDSCVFSRYGRLKPAANFGALFELGNESADNDTTAYNLIENSHFYHGGHHCLGLHGNHNIVRNCYLHNDPWYLADDTLWGYRVVYSNGDPLTNGNNLIDNCRIAFGAECRHTVQSGGTGMKISTPYNKVRRTQFYHNNLNGIYFMTYYDVNGRCDSNYVFHNTFYHNGYDTLAYKVSSGRELTHGICLNTNTGIELFTNNVFKNNIFWADSNGFNQFQPIVQKSSPYYPVADQTISNNWNNESSPRWVHDGSSLDPFGAPPDFTLTSSSPCVDAGTWLTTITSAGGTDDTIEVDDANYFIDGWGIIDGDSIQLEGSTDTLIVEFVDYDNNIIRLSEDVTFTQGQGVAQLYQGAFPDQGTLESPYTKTVLVIDSALNVSTDSFGVVCSLISDSGDIYLETSLDTSDAGNTVRMDTLTDVTSGGARDTLVADGLADSTDYLARVIFKADTGTRIDTTLWWPVTTRNEYAEGVTTWWFTAGLMGPDTPFEITSTAFWFSAGLPSEDSATTPEYGSDSTVYLFEGGIWKDTIWDTSATPAVAIAVPQPYSSVYLTDKAVKATMDANDTIACLASQNVATAEQCTLETDGNKLVLTCSQTTGRCIDIEDGVFAFDDTLHFDVDKAEVRIDHGGGDLDGWTHTGVTIVNDTLDTYLPSQEVISFGKLILPKGGVIYHQEGDSISFLAGSELDSITAVALDTAYWKNPVGYTIKNASITNIFANSEVVCTSCVDGGGNTNITFLSDLSITSYTPDSTGCGGYDTLIIDVTNPGDSGVNCEIYVGDSVVTGADIIQWGTTTKCLVPVMDDAGKYLVAIQDNSSVQDTSADSIVIMAPTLTSLNRDTVYTVGGGTLHAVGRWLGNASLEIGGASQTTSLAADTSVVVPFYDALSAGGYDVVLIAGGDSTDGTDTVWSVANPDTSYFGNIPNAGMVWGLFPASASGISSSNTDSFPVVQGPAAPHKIVADQRELCDTCGFLTDSAGLWIPEDTGFVSLNWSQQVDSTVSFSISATARFGALGTGDYNHIYHEQKTDGSFDNLVYLRVNNTGVGPACLFYYRGVGGTSIASINRIDTLGFTVSDTNTIAAVVAGGSVPYIYINGTKMVGVYAQQTASTTEMSSFLGEANIGKDTYDDDQGLDGVLYNILVYNRALSDGEVSTLHSLGPDLGAVLTANDDGTGNLESNYIPPEGAASGNGRKLWLGIGL